jgi:two-component system cell cycle response regulator DivK
MDKKCVLVIEDHEDTRLIVAGVLSYVGYQVIEAADGEAGVDMARVHHPALVVTDISMPRLDGWGVAERLRSDDETHEIPIIAVTAHDDADVYRRVQEVGIRALVHKPCSPRRIIEEVHRIIGDPVRFE